jgi:competence protein ComEC
MNGAPSMTIASLQTEAERGLVRLEQWLEHERDQLPLWLPVALGIGIAAWFFFRDDQAWAATIVGGLALALAGVAIGWQQRTGRLCLLGGLFLAAGCALIWARADSLTAPILMRPVVTIFEARVERIEQQTAKAQSRLILEPDRASGLPPRIRVTVKDEYSVKGLGVGERISLRARLVPPPEAPVPGAYDFARTAWFMKLGATGSAIAPIARIGAPPRESSSLRAQLSAHVRSKLDGSAGGIAAAFASGDRGGIAPEDEDAMRDSGLTHLLSISGLHITAVVAATLFATLRLLALSPMLALRYPLPLIAAGMGALAGIGYTLLTGAEVPTIRSCIAALLVLAGLAIGREAITLRLVATGALIILLLWPESLIGPSFQLSFAAITVIVALHESSWVQRWTMRRDEPLVSGLIRAVGALLLTGIAVEVALAPIALFHFHKSGVYGALANVIAIPLTTFVTMPLEALALIFDSVGAGAPFWWLTGLSLEFLLWLARTTAAFPGAVAMTPEIPTSAFALIVAGGLWLALWTSRSRLFGLIPIAAGAAMALAVPTPDLLITGDGKHLLVRNSAGQMALLRPKAGDYIRDVLAERSGTLEALADMDRVAGAKCGRDMCAMTVTHNGRDWRIAATRSDYLLPWAAFMQTCTSVDIIVSSRRLPRKCKARWVTADRMLLAKTGGMAIELGAPKIRTVIEPDDDHPWRRIRVPTSSIAQYRRNNPASLP